MEIVEIPLDRIDEDTDQPRYQFDEEALQELMSSIGEIGLLSPIKVRTTDGGRYKIIYGNRRYKASKLLGKATIPCIVSDAVNEMDIYLEQIAENLTREGFSPIEEAVAFDKLINDPRFRSSIKFVSSKLGKPENYIKNKCELLKFSNAVKKKIVSGTEIRKDKLTEEQLMPLKDLPMEHRDPLALIVARDELPVSDVKKIAKLFKDKAISESTKEKLLLKTGSGLIETWSVYEMNRKERAREAAEPKPAARPTAEPKHEAASGATGNAAPGAGGTAESAPQGSAAAAALGAAANVPLQSGATGSVSAPSAQQQDAAAGAEVQPDSSRLSGAITPANAAIASGGKATDIALDMQKLLAVIPAPLSASPNESAYLDSLSQEEAADLLQRAGHIVQLLEEHLAEWRKLQDHVRAGQRPTA